ncbi:MAG: hypothetical protein HQM09_00720 [Candidatus Riflebacteria bacterium]|nr:hypothetical protein [Candidatus Riflebacteria bacterium]
MRRHFRFAPRFSLTSTCLAGAIGIWATMGSASGLTLVGQIESLYRDRVSLKVLEVPGDASGTAPLKAGNRVSFSLPRGQEKGKKALQFGNVVEADLTGNTATEYTDSEGSLASSTPSATSGVMIWTANRVERVKNARKYLGDDAGKEDKEEHKGRRGHGHKSHDKKDKEEEAPKIWTQEETVRGKVLVKDKRLFIKEDFTRPRDKGLDVLEDEWYEKLKPYEGQLVVANGITHRISAASGTMEIKSLIKIYPK